MTRDMVIGLAIGTLLAAMVSVCTIAYLFR
jgi:hypothetical protein